MNTTIIFLFVGVVFCLRRIAFLIVIFEYTCLCVGGGGGFFIFGSVKHTVVGGGYIDFTDTTQNNTLWAKLF